MVPTLFVVLGFIIFFPVIIIQISESPLNRPSSQIFGKIKKAWGEALWCHQNLVNFQGNTQDVASLSPRAAKILLEEEKIRKICEICKSVSEHVNMPKKKGYQIEGKNKLMEWDVFTAAKEGLSLLKYIYE